MPPPGPHNVLEAGSSTQPVVPAPVAAAASSGGGMREQPVNLVHGVPGELASITYEELIYKTSSLLHVTHLQLRSQRKSQFSTQNLLLIEI